MKGKTTSKEDSTENFSYVFSLVFHLSNFLPLRFLAEIKISQLLTYTNTVELKMITNICVHIET